MVTSQTIPTQILRHSSIRCSIVHPYVYSAHTLPLLQCLHDRPACSVTFSLRVFDRFLTGRFLSPYLSTSSLFFCYANELSLHEEKERRSSLPSSSFLFSFFSALRSLCAAAAARSPLQQDWLISKPSLRGIIILPVRFPRKWAAGSNTVVYLVSSAYYLHTTILLKIFRLFRYTFTFFYRRRV